MSATKSLDVPGSQYKLLKLGFGNPKVAPLVERLVRSRKELNVLDVGSGLPRTHLPQIERFLGELAGGKEVLLIGTDATRFPNPAHQEGDRLVHGVTTMIVGDADFAETIGPFRLEKALAGRQRFDIITSLNYFPEPPMPSAYAHRCDAGAAFIVFDRLKSWLAGDGIFFVSAYEAGDLPSRIITAAGYYVVLEMPSLENADARMDPGSHLIVATRAE
jgi:hypothetical protein